MRRGEGRKADNCTGKGRRRQERKESRSDDKRGQRQRWTVEGRRWSDVNRVMV